MKEEADLKSLFSLNVDEMRKSSELFLRRLGIELNLGCVRKSIGSTGRYS